MRIVTSNATLDCSWLNQPELVYLQILDQTKGRDLIQYQEDQKLHWTEYNFQMVINDVAVKAITAAVNEQYINELREEYVGYNNA